ncbi:MAG: triose-phosphate isomerase [Candidatus Taylorbacteria bacterium]|nr:triose-phosphate isomerase [Candidatus Taylorbacteria bacterium]
MVQKIKKRRYVIGNWKMNPQFPAEAKRIVDEVKKISKKLVRTSVVLLPPAAFLGQCLGTRGDTIYDVGVQNIFYEESGSYTGEISADMVKNLGCTYVLAGHSERRKMGETDVVVAKKLASALRAGLTTVVCVGENERDSQGAYLEPLREQIQKSLEGIVRKDLKNLIIAYEPVWAIGAKEAMTSALIYEMTIFIKKVLSDLFEQEDAVKVPILYGGSVNFRNAAEIISQGQVDGLLVGRESVNPPGFVELLKVVDEIQ